MPDSIRFDRAVEYYDRTRALPPDVEAAQTSLLLQELRGRGRVLEIGVGTGRIAAALVRELAIVGLDLSRPMMEVLRSKTTAIPLVEGDATVLPFADGSFDAALAAHVFHLIPEWEAALAELVRVVAPDGVILTTRAGGRTDVGHEVFRRWADAIGFSPRATGADTIEDVDEGARRLGLDVRVLPAHEHHAPVDVAAFVAELEAGMFAGTWDIPDDDRRRAADAVRRWLPERFGSATPMVPATRTWGWHAYSVRGH